MSSYPKTDIDFMKLRKRVSYYRLRLYGVTEKQVARALIKQNHSCPICGKHLWMYDSNAHIDHDHNSGRVRWILCGSCNRGIGSFFENPVFLRNAAELFEKQEYSFEIGDK